MTNNKLKQLALALKSLSQGDTLLETLLELGISNEQLAILLREIATDEESQHFIVPNPGSTVVGRIFSTWERVILSFDAQRLLLSALHTNVITPFELEQVLEIIDTQETSFIDQRELITLLQTVVEDKGRMEILLGSTIDIVH